MRLLTSLTLATATRRAARRLLWSCSVLASAASASAQAPPRVASMQRPAAQSQQKSLPERPLAATSIAAPQWIRLPEVTRAEQRPTPGGQVVSYVQPIGEPPGEPNEPLPPTLQLHADDLALPADGLTLVDFEGIALGCNPSIARAAANVQAARGNWVQVGLRPNPTVGYEGQQLGSGGLAEQHGIFAEQELIGGNKLGLSRNVASQQVAQAERELNAQQQRVLTDVRTAYYDVLIAQEQERLAAELVQTGTRAAEVSQRLFDAQEVRRTDVLQSEIEVEDFRIAEIEARNRRATAWQTLVTVAGQPTMALQRLAGDPAEATPRYDYGEALQRLLSGSPELAAAAADVERARWNVERQRVEARPNVTVRGMYNAIDNGIGGKPDGSVLIGVPLPLWNKNQGGIVQAQGQVAVAERAMQQLQLDLQNRLAAVFERYSNAHNRTTRYRNIVLPKALESYNLSRKAYQAGELDFDSLLTSQQKYAETQFKYLSNVRELRTAAAQIEGFLLSDSLQNR